MILRRRRDMMKRTIIMLSGIIFALFFSGILFADMADIEMEEEVAVYKEKELKAYSGYRLLNIDGYAGKVLEYDYPHSSMTGGIDYSYYTPLLKLYLEGLLLNRKDYSLELDGRYRDLAWMKIFSDSIFHNLDHYDIGLPSSDRTIRIEERNPGDNYGIQYRDSNASVKFKMPDYPAHLILEGRILDREGRSQQRFVNENCATRCHKLSYGRDTDWRTEEFNIGIDGHLGPVELAYIHNSKNFKDKNDVPTFLYGPSFGNRPAGTFEHNKNSDLSSFSNIFKIHTSNTGRIVASGTYTIGKRENDTSGGNVDYKAGAGDFTWVPSSNFTVVVKFRHLDLNVDNPETITVMSKEGTFSQTFPVRPSISSRKNTANMILTWRPLKGVSLRGEYERAETNRGNTDVWTIPDKTTEDAIKFTGRFRPGKNIILKAGYKYRNIDNPVYEDRSSKIHEGTGAITWSPSTIWGVSFNYSAVRGEDTTFERELGSGEFAKIVPVNHSNSRNNLSLLLNINPLKDLSLNANYSYFHDRITSGILYGSQTNDPTTKENYVFWDDNVPYVARSQSVSLGGNLNIIRDLIFSANAHITKSEGAYHPDVLTKTNTFGSVKLTENTSGIGDFSAMEILQKGFSIGLEYTLNNLWKTRINYEYRDYDDRKDNSLDGDVNIIYLTLSKKW